MENEEVLKANIRDKERECEQLMALHADAAKQVLNLTQEISRLNVELDACRKEIVRREEIMEILRDILKTAGEQLLVRAQVVGMSLAAAKHIHGSGAE